MLRHQRIRRKLMTVILLTSSVVLLMACGTFFIYDLLTYRQTMGRNLSMLGKVIAANSAAPLAFVNPGDATEVLSALSADSHVVQAALYDRDGALFASYPESSGSAELPTRPEGDGLAFRASSLILYEPVAVDDRRLGTLYVESDLAATYERATVYAGIVGAVILATCMVAIPLSLRLQRHISEPVLALANASQAVSESQDYSLRVTKLGDDELGQLTDAFNTMLARVQAQDQTLRERGIQLHNEVIERRRAEAEVRELNADLERRVSERTEQLAAVNRELESFSYSVSHDLRAPLRHVMGYVQMLEKALDGQLTPQSQRYMKTIRDASAEMGQLIDDLLAFSRMGRAELQESHVDLDALVRDVIASLEAVTRDRQIEWDIAPLPPVVGDPAMLKQVFANLIDNALKYSRMRTPARIDIGSAGVQQGRVVIFVRDNGAGFDMRYASKLFGVFQRLHRADEFEGTGIGLATVSRIVARHGGRIWAESALDRGATFSFTMRPVEPAPPSVSREPSHDLIETHSAR